MIELLSTALNEIVNNNGNEEAPSKAMKGFAAALSAARVSSPCKAVFFIVFPLLVSYYETYEARKKLTGRRATNTLLVPTLIMEICDYFMQNDKIFYKAAEASTKNKPTRTEAENMIVFDFKTNCDRMLNRLETCCKILQEEMKEL